MHRIMTPLALFGALALLAGAALPLAASEYGDDDMAGEKADIIETVSQHDDFETLVKAVEAAGLTAKLEEKGPYTLFAPTDAAFDKLPDGTLETLLEPENREHLQEILTYHVVPAEVSAKKARTMEKGSTVNGGSVVLSTRGEALRVNSARVVESDIMASNGVIHAIDEVLLPSTSDRSGR